MEKLAARTIFNELASTGLTLRQAVEFTNGLIEDADRLRGGKVAVGPAAAIAAPATAASILKALYGLVGQGAGIGKGLLDTGARTLSAMQPAIIAAAAVPPIVGYTLGDVAASAIDTKPSDVGDLQEEELIQELRTNAERLNRARESRERGL